MGFPVASDRDTCLDHTLLLLGEITRDARTRSPVSSNTTALARHTEPRVTSPEAA